MFNVSILTLIPICVACSPFWSCLVVQRFVPLNFGDFEQYRMTQTTARSVLNKHYTLSAGKGSYSHSFLDH